MKKRSAVKRGKESLAAAGAAPWIAAAGAGLLTLTACNLAPHYERPTTAATPAFKEAVPGDPAGQGWKIAAPRDSAIRGNWWEAYQDPELNDLEARVAISNQTIIAAEASYRAAHALVLEAQAQLFPTFSLDPSMTREKSSAALAGLGGVAGGTTTGTTGTTGTGTGTGTGTTGTGTTGTGTTTATSTTAGAQGGSTLTHNVFTFPLDASYQVDLWGSIRNQVAVNRYAAQASAAQLANALLSTQSSLAQDYFQLRVADEQRRILDTTVGDYQVSLKLVRALVKSGVDSEADVASAQTQLESATAQATDVGVARAQYEHAIAVLIGVPPAKFSIPYKHFNQQLPTIPVGVPSDLLERRPDIAAAERQVAESNAQIGVARAAFFPTLTLSGSAGFESTSLSSLFEFPNRFWSVGPSLAQVLFDGGARRAAAMQARALNDSQVATYRQTVLSAFQSVEDNLAALKILSQELAQAHRATVAAKRAVGLTIVLYRNGVDSYANVIVAQNAFLSARETELQIQLRELNASVSLINDLGGGWSTADWNHTEGMAEHPADDGKEAQIPAVNSGPAVPNPPAMPEGEMRPDDLLKQDDESMGPEPAAGGSARKED
jgi:NodT family efflux transporter outer membrane factor (OMF) lipoprotein